MRAIENTLKIIEAIERTHKNLGVPAVLMKLVDLMDIGGFLIASRGHGKTTVLKAVEKLRHRDVLYINVITPAGAKRIAGRLNNGNLTIINRDFSSFYTDYLKDAGVNFIANLITEHGIRSTTGQYNVDIENCHIAFLSAMQPNMLKAVSKLPSWDSMYKDRFLRIFLLYVRGPTRPTPLEPEPPQIEIYMGNPDIPEKLKKTRAYKRMLKIFIAQTSENRGPLLLNEMLRASARLNNRDIVVKGDIEFLDKAAIYFIPDIMLTERETVGSPLVFNDDAFLILEYLIKMREATKKELAEYFSVSYSTIIRDAEPLIKLGIVSGIFGTQKYVLSQKFIKRYIKPVERIYEVIKA